MNDDNHDKLPSLEELGRSIKQAKDRLDGPTGRKNTISGASIAGRVCADLMAGVGMGALLGYYLDKWLGTWPILMIICLFFGTAGGMMNIYRFVQSIGNNTTKE